jgi:hypothetical protein
MKSKKRKNYVLNDDITESFKIAKRDKSNTHITQIDYNSIAYMCQFLPYVYIVSLSHTCKHFNEMIENNNMLDFRKIVKTALLKDLEYRGSKAEDDVETLLASIKESGSYISGSFLLSCLFHSPTDEHFYGDIDIYSQFKPYHNGKFVKEHAPYFWVKDRHWFDREFEGNRTEIKEYYNFEKLEDTYSHLCAIIARKTRLKHLGVDIIFCNIASIKHIIYSGFDLDILTNIFDGERLLVKSWDKLFKKTDAIRPGNMLTYAYSGVIHDTDSYALDTKFLFKERALHRKRKYIERGFNIRFHSAFDRLLEENTEELRIYINKHKPVDYLSIISSILHNTPRTLLNKIFNDPRRFGDM